MDDAVAPLTDDQVRQAIRLFYDYLPPVLWEGGPQAHGRADPHDCRGVARRIIVQRSSRDRGPAGRRSSTDPTPRLKAASVGSISDNRIGVEVQEAVRHGGIDLSRSIGPHTPETCSSFYTDRVVRGRWPANPSKREYTVRFTQ